MAEKDTYTYTLTMSVSTQYIGSEVEETLGLSDWGYSDQEWDALSESEQEDHLDRWADEYVWEHIECFRRVNRG